MYVIFTVNIYCFCFVLKTQQSGDGQPSENGGGGGAKDFFQLSNILVSFLNLFLSELLDGRL